MAAPTARTTAAAATAPAAASTLMRIPVEMRQAIYNQIVTTESRDDQYDPCNEVSIHLNGYTLLQYQMTDQVRTFAALSKVSRAVHAEVEEYLYSCVTFWFVLGNHEYMQPPPRRLTASAVAGGEETRVGRLAAPILSVVLFPLRADLLRYVRLDINVDFSNDGQRSHVYTSFAEDIFAAFERSRLLRDIVIDVRPAAVHVAIFYPWSEMCDIAALIAVSRAQEEGKSDIQMWIHRGRMLIDFNKNARAEEPTYHCLHMPNLNVGRLREWLRIFEATGHSKTL